MCYLAIPNPKMSYIIQAYLCILKKLSFHKHNAVRKKRREVMLITTKNCKLKYKNQW